MGIFIDIKIDDSHWNPDVASQLVNVCPVDIFTLNEGRFRIDPMEEDECTLCELCLVTAPVGTVKIRKKYNNEELVRRGVEN